MSYTTKLVAFVAFTVLYFIFVFSTSGLIAFASVCHYPDVPGCETDLTILWVFLAVAFGLYVAAIYGFRRWTKEDRGGYR